jgi:hypothetical protein
MSQHFFVSAVAQACGGYFVTFLLFLSMFLFALARLFTAVWLQIWLDAGDGRASGTPRAALIKVSAGF